MWWSPFVDGLCTFQVIGILQVSQTNTIAAHRNRQSTNRRRGSAQVQGTVSTRKHWLGNTTTCQKLAIVLPSPACRRCSGGGIERRSPQQAAAGNVSPSFRRRQSV
jgi:hypothetical protein